MDGKRFNRSAAKAAGYTDDEIDAFLASKQQKTPAQETAPQAKKLPQIAVPADVTRAPRGMSRVERAQEAEKRGERQERFRQEIGAIPAAIANVSRDIPGAEAAQAGVRALVRGQSYREALQDIRGGTDELSPAIAIPSRFAGTALAAAAMPGLTAARQAMAFGALSGATEANPDIGVGERAARTAGGAVLGGLTAKGAEVVGTLGRAFAKPRLTGRSGIEFGARKPAEQMLRQQKATETASEPLYERFRAMGELPETPALQEIMELPVVRAAVRVVKKESPRLAKLPDTDAAVLDAVYKRIGKRAFSSKYGFETGEARNDLLKAIDDAAFEKKIVTGSGELYSAPVGVFREGMKLVGATQRGATAARLAGSPTSGTTTRSALTQSPEAFTRWAQTASPAERSAAIQGVLGTVRQRGLSDVMQPWGIRGGFSLLPGLRRAMSAGELIAQLERQVPRSATRRVAELGIPSYVIPRDRSIPEE